MSSAMLEIFEGAWSDEVADLLAGLEELRILIEPELPATAAMMAATFNEVALPLVQGMRDARDADSLSAANAAMSAYEDRARAGMAEMQRLLVLVDAETADFEPASSPDADLGPLQDGLAISHARFGAEVRTLEIGEHPAVRALQATQNTEARRIAVGDATLRDDLDTAFRLSEVPAAAAKSILDASECGDLSEAKFWYTAGSAVWKFIALMGLILGGWSAMSGITAGLAVALLGGSLALWFIWLLLIVLFTIQLAVKINNLIELLDACACELRGTE